MKRICVFCGSNAGVSPDYILAARRMGEVLVQNQIGLVYGGGKVGLMGAIADSVLKLGGEVIGIIPEYLVQKEVAHKNLTKLEVVDSMHTRKARMAELSDAFVAMPGGFGTFEEFFEIATWAQLGLHKKAFGVLNIAGFYDPFLRFIDHATSEGFIRPEHRQMLLSADTHENLLDLLENYRAPDVTKWLTDQGKA